MIVPVRFISIFVVFCLFISCILCYEGNYEYLLSFLFSNIAVFLILLPIFCKNKILSMVLVTLYGFALGCQLASVFNTGKLLEVLTLANITEVSSVSKEVVYSSLGIIFVFVLAVWVMRGNKSVKLSKFVYLLAVPVLIFYVFCDKTRPMTSFVKTFEQYAEQLYFKPQKQKMEQQMQLYGKDWIYQNTNEKDIPDLRGKNVVALFTEGLSLNMIDKFNDYAGLTPNMSYFMDIGLWFDNYYNHTAATYRGLRGQLGSSYQYAGGEKLGFDLNADDMEKLSKSAIVFLPEILLENSYHSYFICAHKRSYGLVKYLEQMGFDKVFSAGDFIADDRDLTDGEIFYYLADLIKSKRLEEPYFIGFYNVGTHMGYSTRYTVYENPVGANHMELNNLHEYDRRFGEFMKKIEKDDTLKNKMAVILTTDHAFPPTADKLAIFHEFRNHFMDRVPFVIWYEGVKPTRMDVNGKNSLDFAPTLLNWLRIDKAHNYFLGCSLYDEACPYNFEYIHNEGNLFFSTNPYKQLQQSNAEDSEIIKKIRDFYNLSEYRIFEWNL